MAKVKKAEKKSQTYQEDAIRALGAAIAHDLAALLVGHTGTGKTSLIREQAAQHGAQLHRVNLSGQTGTDEILGKHLADMTRGTYWVDGLLVRAMREGHWVVLDEVNMALPDILARLHSLLDDDRMVVLTEKDGEVVRPKEGFRIFATINPDGEYAGTKELNRAFLSRFPIVIEMRESADEASVIADQAEVPMHEAELLAAFGRELRASKNAEKMLYYASTRDLIYAGQLTQKGLPLDEAIRAAIVHKAPREDREVVEKIAELLFKGYAATKGAAGETLSEIMRGLEAEKAQADAIIAENTALKERIAKIEGALAAL